MFRRIVLAAAIATLPVLSPVALLGQQAPKNLKVLPKDTSPDQLMKIMHGYTQALGVHCNFCHVVNEATRTPDFASDAKPEKNTARTMMLIYNLPATDAIYQRFAGIDGSAYFIGGFGMTALASGNIIVVPIRSGVGLRLGANIGYLKFTPNATWNPF